MMACRNQGLPAPEAVKNATAGEKKSKDIGNTTGGTHPDYDAIRWGEKESQGRLGNNAEA